MNVYYACLYDNNFTSVGYWSIKTGWFPSGDYRNYGLIKTWANEEDARMEVEQIAIPDGYKVSYPTSKMAEMHSCKLCNNRVKL